MKTLILTEKPSVAMDFAKALQKKINRFDGYLEDEYFIITWAVGHLVELFEPHDYDKKWKQWNLDLLPIIPLKFEYKPIQKTSKQYHIIKNLLNKKKINTVVIATDAGREGEVIARTILLGTSFINHAGISNENVKRFWTSQALTVEVIEECMNALKPASQYDRLWYAGQSRQIADWLVGINGSRAASIKMNDLFSVGRVQTAVLSLIVERCKQRGKFNPEPYYLLHVNFKNAKGSWIGTWFNKKNLRFYVKNDAEKLLSEIEGQEGIVSNVKKIKKKEPPPLLYSLTHLQRDANMKFGFSAKKTLDIAQRLYEKKKCLSYPRTDSNVLGTKNIKMIENLVIKFSKIYGKYFKNFDNTLVNVTNKKVFNDEKLTDHHALIPLNIIPQNSSDEDNKIYGVVLKRFASVFHKDCEFEQTEIITEIKAKGSFRTKGKVILNPGWKTVYENDNNKKAIEEDEPLQENLPPLEKGDKGDLVHIDLINKLTSPPPEYSESLLLKDMTNPGKYISEKDLKKIYRGDVGLGTQATRAQIIETLLGRKYIIRVKKKLISTEKGNYLIETLKKFSIAKILITPEETARWERNLQQIAFGETSKESFVEGIKKIIEDTVTEFKSKDIKIFKALMDGNNKKIQMNSIGKCPNCDGGIIENSKAFGCSNWKNSDGACPFVIWKKIAGKDITKEIAITLLEKKIAGPYDDFISKQNKNFFTTLKLIEENKRWKVIFDFLNNITPQEPFSTDYGKCPVCKGKIIKGKKGYGCSNWSEEKGGCIFVIWENISGVKLLPSDIKILIQGNETPYYLFDNDNNKKLKAKLKLIFNPENQNNDTDSSWTTEFVL